MLYKARDIEEFSVLNTLGEPCSGLGYKKHTGAYNPVNVGI